MALPVLRPRALALFTALLCLAAALFPEAPLALVPDAVARMRAPAQAPAMARVLAVAGTVAFAGIALAWVPLRRFAAAGFTRLVQLSPPAFLALVAALALLPRLAVALIPYEPTSDAAWYHAAAAALARGEGLAVGGQLTAYRPPGSPFLLSLTYRAFGVHAGLAWAWGLLGTAVLLVALHALARRLHGAAVARLVTVAAALYPALVFMTGQTMSELPFAAGLTALAWFMVACAPHRPGNALLAGLAAGLLTLTRGAGIVLLPALPLLWHLRDPRALRTLRTAVLVFAGFAVAVAPWALRNRAHFGRAVLGTNQGLNLAIGNHPGASGGYEAPPPLPSPGNEAEADQAHQRQALAYLSDQPLDALLRLPRKLLHLGLLETSAVTGLLQGPRSLPPWLRLGLYALSQLAWLAVLGLLLLRAADCREAARRPQGAQWTGPVLIAALTLLCLVFFGNDRFRLPMLPWLLLEGAVAVAGRLGLTLKYARQR